MDPPCDVDVFCQLFVVLVVVVFVGVVVVVGFSAVGVLRVVVVVGVENDFPEGVVLSVVLDWSLGAVAYVVVDVVYVVVFV